MKSVSLSWKSDACCRIVKTFCVCYVCLFLSLIPSVDLRKFHFWTRSLSKNAAEAAVVVDEVLLDRQQTLALAVQSLLRPLKRGCREKGNSRSVLSTYLTTSAVQFSQVVEVNANDNVETSVL